MKLARQAREVEIPTASTADIAFLLIIFFVVAGVFGGARGVNFPLSRKDAASVESRDPGIVVRLRHAAAGHDELLLDRHPVERARLLLELDAMLENRPDTPVLFYIDPDTSYGAMVEVYDELLRAKAVTGRAIARLFVPTRADVDAYVRALGYNPFTADAP